jgi:FRG domain-containing protein
MTIKRLPLDGLTHEHAYLEPVPSVGYNVFHAKKPYVLVQAAGYLKHIRAKSRNKSVYFRGQSKLYPTIPPTLYRGIKSRPQAREKRDAQMNALLRAIRRDKLVLRAISNHVQEPILQHYGLKTRWLDVVDNVWIALWFACYMAHSFGKHGEYLHFEKRIVRHVKPDESFAYILLLESAATPNAKLGPGCFKDDDSATIDLRIAAPSHFVRPHAQHGLVIKSLDKNGKAPLNFSPLLVGIIRVDLADALEWLGSGDMLNVHALFPPPPYDVGYQEILNNVTESSEILGAIHHIGAGT